MAYGVIEYNEAGLPKCEICGKPFKKLLAHVYQKHGLLKREYKKQFGLALNKGILCNESYLKIRKSTMKRASFISNNIKMLKEYQFEKGCKGRTREHVSAQTRLELKQRLSAIPDILLRNGRSASFDKELTANREVLLRSFPEEIVSITLLEAMQCHKRWNPKRCKMLTWLFAIAKNIQLAKYKDAGRYTLHADYAFVDSKCYQEHELDIPVIKNCMAASTPHQHEVLQLLSEGYKVKELSERYGKDPVYMKSYVCLARRKLTERLRHAEML